jgi:hypothetical protein
MNAIPPRSPSLRIAFAQKHLSARGIRPIAILSRRVIQSGGRRTVELRNTSAAKAETDAFGGSNQGDWVGIQTDS